LPFPEGKKKAAFRWSTLAWKVSQFLVETLKIPVDSQRVGVFLEKVPDFKEVFLCFYFQDPKHIPPRPRGVSNPSIFDGEYDY
jgi:hypothetical protein